MAASECGGIVAEGRVRMARGKTLWLDCQSGIAGDMLVAALLDLAEDPEVAERAVRAALGSLPVDGFSIEVGRVSRVGISCLDFDVVLDGAHENHDHDMEYLHGADGHRHGHGRSRGHDRGHDHDPAHDPAYAHDPAHVHECGHPHGRSHVHRNLADILALIDGAAMAPAARAFARRAFGILAEAEAEAHGVPVDQVHFHEVGAVDSIADMLAAAVLVDLLGIEHAVVPVLVEGSGTVRCQHGVMPVPVPATLGICRAHGLPLAPCDVQGELVTPTGAALVAALSPSFELPARYTVSRMGLGAGKRAYTRPSILRAMLIDELPDAGRTAAGRVDRAVADSTDRHHGRRRPHLSSETNPPVSVCKLECDLDDMTGEQMAHAAERLRDAGAREVHWAPIFAKKGRPAYELRVLCAPDEAERIGETMLLETSALGVRRCVMERAVLPRRLEVRETAYGPITVKCATLPDGSERVTPEYEDCAAAARRTGAPLATVMDAARLGSGDVRLPSQPVAADQKSSAACRPRGKASS